jgi:hypothetical protein
MDKRCLTTLGVLGAGAVVTGLVVWQSKRQPEFTAPDVPFEEVELVSQEDILAAADFVELDDYYVQISLLYRSHEISFEEYMVLYNAYVQRFDELWEVSA